ncbi:MAG TPA: hypothetical protein VFH78_13285 [Candidatus Thermoplasmatota archaeon]|nr:hypothetical protein [Candidatus Thermoplasmatota archaeon]
MDGKSHVFLVLALAATSLAGCIEAASFLNTSDVEVSAFENRKAADKAAREWHPEAQLVSVLAFELTQSQEESIAADPEVGNGLAPAWWYVYCATSESSASASEEGAARSPGRTEAKAMAMPQIRAFKVAADGTVTSEDEAAAFAAGYAHDMVGDLSNWKVDSVDALAAAKANETFRKVAEGFNASLVEGVASHEGITAWFFAAMSADGFVVATVDAVNGVLLEVSAIDLQMTVPTFEWGARDPLTWTAEPIVLRGEGQADSGTPPLSLPFVTSSAMHGTLTLSFHNELPSDGIRWAILDADGEKLQEGGVGSWNGGDDYTFEVELKKAGDYVFELSYWSWTSWSPLALPVGGVDFEFTLELFPGHVDNRVDRA